MSVVLTYGNKPPSRADVQIGNQVKTSTLALITSLEHELWANAGELCGELIYDGSIGTWKTTSTSYVQAGAATGSQYDLQRCSPLVDLFISQQGGSSIIIWRAFVRNLQVQVSILNPVGYATVIATNASATNNTPQWIGTTISVSSVPIQRVVRIEARRLAFDTSGELSQIALHAAPASALQIPGYL